MKIQDIKELCTGCGACSSSCPQSCIKMEYDEEGFYYPQINKDECIECGMCERSCHMLNHIDSNTRIKSYYGWLSDKDERYNSSSGGAFYAMAKYVLDKGGIVFGAAFDYEKRVLKHVSSEEVELEELRKSKYVESYMGQIIKEVKNQIQNNRLVLFCGTPCQVSGLLHVIRGTPQNLITVDFVCHGVPSSRLFIEHLSSIHNSERLVSIDFRSKKHGWTGKNIELITKTKTKTRTRHFTLDSYYYGFMTCNAFLRKSCYDCQFREKHCGDITIADFWGYYKYDKSINDEKGISLIMGNTDKGVNIIESMEGFDLFVLDNKYSDYAFEKANMTGYLDRRNKFYQIYKNDGFEKAARKTYMRNHYILWLKWLKRKILKL